MTLQEFAALKPGDAIENPMSGSRGRVVEISDSGVKVAWATGNSLLFFYSVNSTAWMHWIKSEDVS